MMIGCAQAVTRGKALILGLHGGLPTGASWEGFDANDCWVGCVTALISRVGVSSGRVPVMI